MVSYIFQKKTQISALESKKCSNQQSKSTFLWYIIWFTYDYVGYLMYYSAIILWFDHFLDTWAEICQIFRWFFGKLKNIKKTFFKSVKTGRQFKALIQINQSEFRCMVCETTISSKSELQPHFIERRHERYGQNYKEVAIPWVSPRTTKLDGPHSEGNCQIWIIETRPNSWDPNYALGADFLDHNFLSSKNSG